MATLDSSIVNIALPTLTKEFQVSLPHVKWVVILYLMVISCGVLPAGKIADQYGRKKIFLLGYGFFTIGSALCGLSVSINSLLGARVIQGLGAAMMMANGPAIVTSLFPSEERGAALGTLGMVVSAGLISGPSVGGLLITYFGWYSIFLVNVPVGLIGLYLVFRFIESDPPIRKKIPFDWVGAILQSMTLIVVLFFFDPPTVVFNGQEGFFISRWIIGFIALAFAAIFIQVETQATSPLFDFQLLKNKTFWTANLASFFTFVSYSSVAFLMPFFLEEVLLLDPDHAGGLMTAIPVAIFIVAPISGRLSDRWGNFGLSVSGSVVGMLTLFSMAGLFGKGLHETIGEIWIVIFLVFVGIWIGLFQSPNNSAILGNVPIERLSSASAMSATIRNLGMVLGTGLATTLFHMKEKQTEDFVSSLQFTLMIAGLVAIGSVLAAFGKKRSA